MTYIHPTYDNIDNLDGRLESIKSAVYYSTFIGGTYFTPEEFHGYKEILRTAAKRSYSSNQVDDSICKKNGSHGPSPLNWLGTENQGITLIQELGKLGYIPSEYSAQNIAKILFTKKFSVCGVIYEETDSIGLIPWTGQSYLQLIYLVKKLVSNNLLSTGSTDEFGIIPELFCNKEQTNFTRKQMHKSWGDLEQKKEIPKPKKSAADPIDKIFSIL